jgi:hypothetical protein
MKRSLVLLITSIFLAAPMLTAQDSDHVEVGAFVDYFRLSNNAAPVCYVPGVGGRAAFNVNPDVQLEAEVADDFKRNYTNTFSNAISGETVNSNFRSLHGFFGPKFQTGLGAFRVFGTGKVGSTTSALTIRIHKPVHRQGRLNHSRLNQGGDLFRALPGGEQWRLLLVRLVCGLKLATISTSTAGHTLPCELRLVRSCGSRSKRVWRPVVAARFGLALAGSVI